jgi:hypothetical protein
MNRYKRVAYSIALLLLGVLLTTVLVLAGERNSEGNSSSIPQSITVRHD